MVYRLILPDWAKEEFPERKKVLEGEYAFEQLQELNAQFYNVYWLPNYPSQYDSSTTVSGEHIDTFQYAFADMDLKDGVYKDKEAFLETLGEAGIMPTFVVDSGNGVHAYWKVTDLDAMSFLKLQRRIIRKFNTDEAVAKIYQLMRLPQTNNTKDPNNIKPCQFLYEGDAEYTCEELDKKLPALTQEDAVYCEQHYGKTYKKKQTISINEEMPLKWAQLVRNSKEVQELWTKTSEDRSGGDFRLGHLMFAAGFTADEALSVLVNSAKASERAPVHRIGYAQGIVDKIWTYEITQDKQALNLSSSVREILESDDSMSKGERLPCWKWVDDTEGGFRRGQVIGLVGGSGVGKTSFALNMFEGFVKGSPNLDHFFVSLEQPKREIAARWKTMCGDNTGLHDKVHIIDNYDSDGNFRDLSLDTIKDYIVNFQKINKKIGCVVIDHIGVLANNDKYGQDEGVKKLCKQMKVFALQTDTLLVMQSQTSREKAGIGDLELNKDAAFGTSVFENYCDFLITLWQPIKRCYAAGAPTVCAFKFCKIRHKKQNKDFIKEDERYSVIFDPDSERLRELTEKEQKSLSYFNARAVTLRKQDRKTELIVYTPAKADDFVEVEKLEKV